MSKDAQKTGKLYLIPTPIADNTSDAVITPQVKAVVKKLDYFLVENLRTARRYISSLSLGLEIESLQFELLDKNTEEKDAIVLLKPLLQGKDAGLISEAGCPGIADPGALAVKIAHQWGIQVVPLVGPSSILLALMASGFSGQSFVFHGYLPINRRERKQAILKLEANAQKLSQTQIFMETPYRNNNLLEDLVQCCHATTLLCIAKNITAEDEFIKSLSVNEWKKNKPDLHKMPVIFLLSSAGIPQQFRLKI